MITEKPWKEFRDAGLLWWVNRILHTFGWAIVYEFDDNEKLKKVYPARVKFRGFDTDTEEANFTKVHKYLAENADELLREIKE